MFKKQVEAVTHSFHRMRARYEALCAKYPWLNYLRGAYLRFSDLALVEASAAASYYLILAVFPLLIALVSLFSMIDQGQTQEQLHILMHQGVLPESVGSVIDSIITEIKQTSRSYSVLSLSLLVVIWTATKGVGALLHSLNRVYKQELLKNVYVRRLLGFFGIFLLIFILMLFLFLISIGDQIWASIFTALPFSPAAPTRLLARYATSMLLLCFVFTNMYYFISGRLGRYLDAARGALFTSLSWTLFPFIFNLFIANQKQLNLYGSVAGIIAVLLWLYFSCQMVLIGAFIHTESVRLGLKHGRIVFRP